MFLPFLVPHLLYSASNEDYIGLLHKPLLIQNQLIVLFTQIYFKMDQTI